MKNMFLENFREMLKDKHQDCLSLYMPIQPPGKDDEQNRIRFKNLLQQSEELFLEKGYKRGDVDKILEPARELLEKPAFFRTQDKSLALFLAGDFFYYHFLPYMVKEQVRKDCDFFVTPIVPMLHGDGQYFVMGIKKDDARLFMADRSHIFEIDIQDLIKEIKAIMDLTNSEKHLAHHSVSGSTGGPGAIFHGQDDSAFIKEGLKEFYRLLDEKIRAKVKPQELPMILAGVDYLHPLFQEVSSYPQIVSPGIMGNPDDWEVGKLHEKTWSTMQPLFNQEMISDMDTFHQRKGTGTTSGNLEEIAEKASYGQVAAAFINLDDSLNDPEMTLVNRTVVETIKNGGRVYGVTPAEMPEPLPVAALFRY